MKGGSSFLAHTLHQLMFLELQELTVGGKLHLSAIDLFH